MLPAFADKDTNGDFCALLVDYVSAWHFEVCEQLVSEAKAFGDEKALKLAEEINPRINDSTQVALAFNDHCAKGECKTPSALPKSWASWVACCTSASNWKTA